MSALKTNRKGKMRTQAKFAKRAGDLARVLEVDVKTIQRWRKEPGFPRRGARGWLVEAVLAWAAGRGSRTATSKGLLDAERTERIELLKAKRAVISGEYMPMAEAREALIACCAALKRELDRVRLELSTRLVGLTAAQANVEMETAFRRVLETVSTGKWPTTCPHCGKSPASHESPIAA